MTKSACKPLTRGVAIALLAVIALSSGYALKMAAEYAMGPGPDAAARLKVFQQEKDLYGVEHRLASETFDDEGDATYVFEAVGGEDARVVIEPRFYPVLEIEFVPAGFIRVSSPPIRVSTPFSAIWRRYSDERGRLTRRLRIADAEWLFPLRAAGAEAAFEKREVALKLIDARRADGRVTIYGAVYLAGLLRAEALVGHAHREGVSPAPAGLVRDLALDCVAGSPPLAVIRADLDHDPIDLEKIVEKVVDAAVDV